MDPGIIGRTVIHEGWGRYLLLDVAMRDGTVVKRQLDDHGRAAAVLAYDPVRRTALLARLPRVGPLFLGEPPRLIEACAGRLDPGEDEVAGARREAMEELGVRLGELEPLGRPYASPGVCTETLGLFLAPYRQEDRLTAGGGADGEHEDIEVLELDLTALWRMAETGEVRDLKTLFLIYALRQRRPDLFG